MPETKLTAKNMKKILWDVLQKVKAKKMSPAEADAVASQSREIIRVVKTQESIIQKCGEEVTAELKDFAIK